MTMNTNRTKKLNQHEFHGDSVVYLMSRDQRIEDNWALIFAQELANQHNAKLIIVFNLLEEFLNAQSVHFNFLMNGLIQTAESSLKYNIPFYLTKSRNLNNLSKFLIEMNVGALVLDFDPLKIKQNIKNDLLKLLNIQIYEVDAHNIVPVWIASSKQEFGAYTIRPKINKLLPEYLCEFPKIEFHKQNVIIDTESIINNIRIEADKFSNSNKFFKTGTKSAIEKLNSFIGFELDDYNELRNFPELDKQSGLSPYLHFGQISAQRIAIEVQKSIARNESKEAFLEELIVRKELADNFCYYNQNYDNFDGFPDWAKKTIDIHRNDKREYVYSTEAFENGETHDKYWNAAQFQMLNTGKMHGYMRMYWAKKILEWTESPEKAMEVAIYLNDKYQLDGRDSNGYTGIAWSIGGVHDRAWTERPIFGKIRYMNEGGLKRKFDIEKYVKLNQYKNHLFA